MVNSAMFSTLAGLKAGRQERLSGVIFDEMAELLMKSANYGTDSILSCCRQAQNPANNRPMTTTAEPFIVRLAEPFRGHNRRYPLHEASSSYHSHSCNNALSSPS